jgi:ATP-dependent Lhr-like helicase
VVVTAAGKLAFAAERAALVASLYPGAYAGASSGPAAPPDPAVQDEATEAIVRGHAEIAGPFTLGSLAARLGLDAGEVERAAAKLESDGLVLRGRFTPGAAADEVCDRRLLARIHRLTLDRLRSEIEPVSAQDFLRYLFDRHHLTARSRLGGRAGLREAIEMVQGFEVAAAAWEGQVLAPRVAGYRPEWLDELCLAGELAWGRLSPRRSTSTTGGSTSRATPITLAFRRDLGWMLEAVRGGDDPAPPGSPAAMATLETLVRRGALFLDDIETGAGLSRDDVEAALWELVGRGQVTSDGWQPLRELLASGRAKSWRRRPQGRWSIVERGPTGVAAEDLADRVAGQLLARYGVVFRELLARESFVVPWRDVVRSLRRQEARGLLRGGRFVAGFIGEQYALPGAVEALRSVRRRERSGEVVRLRASDPLNLLGVLTPGPRTPTHHGPALIFRDGAPVAEESGETLVTAPKKKPAKERSNRPHTKVPGYRTLPAG